MIRKLIARCYNRFLYKEIIDVFEGLQKKTISNFSSNNEIQTSKLLKLLKVAFDSVPYYRELGKTVSLDNFSYKEFLKIPILTKDIIRFEQKELHNKSYEKMRGVFKNTSGGSTGAPVEFYRTQNQAIHGMANYYYALHLNNVNIYDRSVDLWGAERDMYKINAEFDFKSFLRNKETLNTFVLSESIISDYVARLNIIKPRFIKAYVHSIYDIAKFINENSIRMKFTPIIHCTTGPLYPEMRREIKRAFNNAHVYSFYGSREVSAIATETLEENGMSVLYDNVIVEVLDDDHNPVKKGEEGNVVVTTLNNFYMPLIRYKIGDRAIKGDEIDFGTLKLEAVVGRTLGVIYRSDGSKIDGQFFTTLFFNRKGIKNFQLVQKTLNDLVLNIVKSNAFDQEELNEVLSRLHKELPAVNIEINFCDTINLTSTGKIMYVYSELQH